MAQTSAIAQATTPPDMERAAYDLLGEGFRVFPLHIPMANGGCSCRAGLDCSSIGKHPRTRSGHLDATSSEAVARVYWQEDYPGANIGLATGKASRVAVIDVDVERGGLASLSALEAAYGELPETRTVVTGSGGFHLYFRYPDREDTRGEDYRIPPSVDSLVNEQTGEVFRGLDVRADGGFVVAPPSLHKSGRRYEWNGGTSTPLADLPDWLERLMIAAGDRGASSNRGPIERGGRPVFLKGERANYGEGAQIDGNFWLTKALDRAYEGNRNTTGFWLACQLRDAGADFYYAEEVLESYSKLVPNAGHGYRTRDALASLEQAYKRPPRDPAISAARRSGVQSVLARQRAAISSPAIAQTAPNVVPFPTDKAKPAQDRDASSSSKRDRRSGDGDAGGNDDGGASGDGEGETEDIYRTDMGNARRFVKMWANHARYCAPWARWLTWDGMRWKLDESQQVARMAKMTAKAILKEAADIEDDTEAQKLIKWAMSSQDNARLKAMLAVASSEPEISTSPDDFDNQPWLLTVLNGTLDLRSGKLGPFRKEDLITRLAPVRYDPKAKAPNWQAFIARIFDNKSGLIDFIQRAAGYSLTDSIREQVMFMLHGEGQNGKSVLLEALAGVAGDYAMNTPTTTLMSKRDGNIPNDVARLKGARLVQANETAESHSLDEALIKDMTGSPRLTARFLRAEFFDFRPTFKIWLACNHLPSIRGTDKGIWRRIRRIPFTVVIPDEERDNELADKLRAEYSGILNWMLAGCARWLEDGLGMPEEIAAATREYQEQQDQFGRFIEDCCLRDAETYVSQKVLRNAYTSWCDENGERPWSVTRIGKELLRLQVSKYRESGSGATMYRGIGLRTQG